MTFTDFLIRLILNRETKLEKMIMTVSTDVQAIVDKINALPGLYAAKEASDEAAATAQRAEDVAALDAAATGAEPSTS